MKQQQSSLYFNTSLDAWELTKPVWVALEGISLSDRNLVLVDQAYAIYQKVIEQYNMNRRRGDMFTYLMYKLLFAILIDFTVFFGINMSDLVDNYPIWKLTTWNSIPFVSLGFFMLLVIVTAIVSARYTAHAHDLEPDAKKAKEKLLSELKEILK